MIFFHFKTEAEARSVATELYIQGKIPPVTIFRKWSWSWFRFRYGFSVEIETRYGVIS